MKVSASAAKNCSSLPTLQEAELIHALINADAKTLFAVLQRIQGWQFESQADLCNWADVLNRFDRILEAALRHERSLICVWTTDPPLPRPPVASNQTGVESEKRPIDSLEDAEIIPPTEFDTTAVGLLVFEVLRFSAALLENATSKHVYNSLEHVINLLGAQDDAIATVALQVVTAVATPPLAHRQQGESQSYNNIAQQHPSLLRLLISLSHGFGSLATGLGIFDCVVKETEELASPPEVLTIFCEPPESSESGNVDESSNLAPSIPVTSTTSLGEEGAAVLRKEFSIRDFLGTPESAADSFQRLTKEHRIATRSHFALLCSLRQVKAFSSKRERQKAGLRRLYALTAMLYIFNDSDVVSAFFAGNPELVQEVVQLVSPGIKSKEVPRLIQLQAISFLSALANDRGSGHLGPVGRHSGVLQVLEVSRNYGLLSCLVREAVAMIVEKNGEEEGPQRVKEGDAYHLLSSSASSSSKRGSLLSSPPLNPQTPLGQSGFDEEDIRFGVAFVEAVATQPFTKVAERPAFVNLETDFRFIWAEAVLQLASLVASMSSGSAALTDSGLIPLLLSVVETETEIVKQQQQPSSASPSVGKSTARGDASPVSSSQEHRQYSQQMLLNYVTSQCCQILESLIANYSTAASLFRDINGIDLLIRTLKSAIEKALASAGQISTENAKKNDPTGGVEETKQNESQEEEKKEEQAPVEDAEEEEEDDEDEELRAAILLSNAPASSLFSSSGMSEEDAVTLLDAHLDRGNRSQGRRGGNSPVSEQDRERLQEEERERDLLQSIKVGGAVPSTSRRHRLSPSRELLVTSLLNAISVSLQSQGALSTAGGGTGSGNRLREEPLTFCLREIFSHVRLFGGLVFAIASTLMSDTINGDPTSVSHVHDSGLASAFLTCLTQETLPEVPALIMAIPTVLNSLSLTATGAEAVEKAKPLSGLLKLFSDPRYVSPHSRCFHGDLPSIVGAGLDELIRHVPSFREIGMKACVEAIHQIRFVGEKLRADEARFAQRKSQGLLDRQSLKKDEQQLLQQQEALLEMIGHIAQLMEPLLTKSEHASSFTDAGGADALIALYSFTLPSTHLFLTPSWIASSLSASDSLGNALGSSALNLFPSHPACQALSLAFRAYGAQQPVLLLGKLVNEIDSQFAKLAEIRSSLRASLPLSYSAAREKRQQEKEKDKASPQPHQKQKRQSRKGSFSSKNSRGGRRSSGREEVEDIAAGESEEPAFSALGLLDVVPNVRLDAVVNDNAEIGKGNEESVQKRRAEEKNLVAVADYFRTLAMVEWLTSLLSSMIRSANSHGPGRLSYVDYTSSRTLDVVRRLFSLDRTLLMEKSRVLALMQNVREEDDREKRHVQGEPREGSSTVPMEEEKQPEAQHSASNSPSSKTKEEGSKAVRIRDLSVAIFSRFAFTARQLHVMYGKVILTQSLQPHRSGSAALLSLSPMIQYDAISNLTSSVLKDSIEYSSVSLSKSSTATTEESKQKAIAEGETLSTIQCGYLQAVVENATALLFDDRRQAANTVFLIHLLQEGVLSQLVQACISLVRHGITLSASVPEKERAIEQLLKEDKEPEAKRVAKIDAESALDAFKRSILSAITTSTSLLKRLSAIESILASPLTATILLAETAEATRTGFDSVEFAMDLRKILLPAIKPLWTDPGLSHLPSPAIVMIMSVVVKQLSDKPVKIETSASAAETARQNRRGGDTGALTSASRASGASNTSSSSRRTESGARESERGRQRESGNVFTPDPDIVTSLIDMGFTRVRSETALRRVRANNLELAMEFMLSHPEEDMIEELALANAVSSSVATEDSAEESTEREFEDVSMAHAGDGEEESQKKTAEESKREATEEEATAPLSVFELYEDLESSVDTIVLDVLEAKCQQITWTTVPHPASSSLENRTEEVKCITDLLMVHSGVKDLATFHGAVTGLLLNLHSLLSDGKQYQSFVAALGSRLSQEASRCSAKSEEKGGATPTLWMFCHVASLYLHGNAKARRYLLSLFPSLTLELAKALRNSLEPSNSLLAALTSTPVKKEKSKRLLSSSSAAAEGEEKKDSGPHVGATTNGRLAKQETQPAIGTWIGSAFLLLDLFAQFPGEETKEKEETDSSSNSRGFGVDKREEEKSESHRAKSPEFISASGIDLALLSEEEMESLLVICVRYLSCASNLPPLSIQAVLTLLARLLRFHSLAATFVTSLNGLSYVLTLPCSAKFEGISPLVGRILRHILEDPHTLQAAMETEIKQAIQALQRRSGSSTSSAMDQLTPRNFLAQLAPVACRNPQCFLRALESTVEVEKQGSRSIVRLREESTQSHSQASASQAQSQAHTEGEERQPSTSAESVTGSSSQQHHVSISSPLRSSERSAPSTPLTGGGSQRSRARSRSSSLAMTLSGQVVSELILRIVSGRVSLLLEKEKESSSTPAVSESALSSTDLLNILGDLVSVFPSCATAIHKFPSLHLPSSLIDRKIYEKSAANPFVAFLFHDLLPCPKTEQISSSLPKGTVALLKEKGAESRSTSRLILALCARPGEGRKRILLELGSAFVKGPLQSTKENAATSALHAWSELTFTLLSTKSNNGNHRHTHSSSSSQLSWDVAKIITDIELPKSFAKTLETMDAQNRNAPLLFNLLLRILEVLTRLSVAEHINKMGQTSSSTTGSTSRPSSTAHSTGELRRAEQQEHSEQRDESVGAGLGRTDSEGRDPMSTDEGDGATGAQRQRRSDRARDHGEEDEDEEDEDGEEDVRPPAPDGALRSRDRPPSRRSHRRRHPFGMSLTEIMEDIMQVAESDDEEGSHDRHMAILRRLDRMTRRQHAAMEDEEEDDDDGDDGEDEEDDDDGEEEDEEEEDEDGEEEAEGEEVEHLTIDDDEEESDEESFALVEEDMLGGGGAGLFDSALLESADFVPTRGRGAVTAHAVPMPDIHWRFDSSGGAFMEPELHPEAGGSGFMEIREVADATEAIIRGVLREDLDRSNMAIRILRRGNGDPRTRAVFEAASEFRAIGPEEEGDSIFLSDNIFRGRPESLLTSSSGGDPSGAGSGPITSHVPAHPLLQLNSRVTSAALGWRLHARHFGAGPAGPGGSGFGFLRGQGGVGPTIGGGGAHTRDLFGAEAFENGFMRWPRREPAERRDRSGRGNILLNPNRWVDNASAISTGSGASTSANPSAVYRPPGASRSGAGGASTASNGGAFGVRLGASQLASLENDMLLRVSREPASTPPPPSVEPAIDLRVSRDAPAAQTPTQGSTPASVSAPAPVAPPSQVVPLLAEPSASLSLTPPPPPGLPEAPVPPISLTGEEATSTMPPIAPLPPSRPPGRRGRRPADRQPIESEDSTASPSPTEEEEEEDDDEGGDRDRTSDTAVSALGRSLDESSLRSPGSEQHAESQPSVEIAGHAGTSEHEEEDEIARAIELSLSGGGAPSLSPRATASSAPAGTSTLDSSGAAATAAAVVEAVLSSPTSPPLEESQRAELVSSHAPPELGQDPAEGSAEATCAAHPSQSEEQAAPSSSPALQCPEGFDPEVFAALPPEMQEEVIGANRPGAGTGAESGMEYDLEGLDPEALAALPEDIRREVLEQQDRERRAREREREQAADPNNAQEMDNASFLATLTPDLREEVLMTVDDAFLATLPANLRAEAQLLRERAFSGYRGFNIGLGETLRSATSAASASAPTSSGGRGSSRQEQAEGGRRGQTPAPAAAHRNEIMLDREPTTLPSTVRILISDSAIKRVLCNLLLSPALTGRLLQKLLFNLCRFQEARGGVLDTLVSALLLASADYKPNGGRAVLDSTRREIASVFGWSSLEKGEEMTASSSASSSTLSEEFAKRWSHSNRGSPLLPRRILDILTHITRNSINSSVYMLELKSGAGSAGEELATVSGIPMVEQLISLINRKVFSVSSSNMDRLVQLLETVVSPLSRLEAEEEEEERKKQEEKEKREAEEKRASEGVEESKMETSEDAQAAQQTEEPNKTEERMDVEGATSGESPAAPKDNWVAVPRPVLQDESLAALVYLLTLDICNDPIFQRASVILTRLSVLRSNRERLVSQLVVTAKDLAVAVTPSLSELYQHVQTHEATQSSPLPAGDAPQTAAVQSDLSRSLPSSSLIFSLPAEEQKLLRVIQTLSSLTPKAESFSVFAREIDLTALWDVLSLCLSATAAQVGLGHAETTVSNTGSSSPPQPSTPEARERAHRHRLAVPVAAASSSLASSSAPTPGMSSTASGLMGRFLPLVEMFFVVNARDVKDRSLEAPKSTLDRSPAVSITAVLEEQNRQAESKEGEEKKEDGEEEKKEGEAASSSPIRVIRRDTDQPMRDRSPSPADSSRYRSSSPEKRRGDGDKERDSVETKRLVTFVEQNRILLNAMARENPSLLDGTLAALIKLPRCRQHLDFDNKRSYFRSQMRKLRQSANRRHGSIRMTVRRDMLFEDSFHHIRHRTAEEMRGRLQVTFQGEEGIDAGGLTREWYTILAREIFNPNYALFIPSQDSPTFQPNPLSYINKDHLAYFKFVGRIIGKAIADGQLLDAHFTRSFYKHIIGIPVTFHDIEAIDPQYYKNLSQMLMFNIEDLCLELTFSVERSNFGRMEVVDLIPNGRHVAVTDEFKMDYVRLVTHHKMTDAIKDQIKAFLEGFHDLVPPELVALFNEKELELLISGTPEIDVDDLKCNTDYASYKATDQQIRWFWNVLYSFSQEERALFLQFVTGTSKVPLEGFKALQGMRGTQRFSIHKAYGGEKALPSAHTCFNQLDLPEYTSEEQLRERLLLAIRVGSEGFGFG